MLVWSAGVCVRDRSAIGFGRDELDIRVLRSTRDRQFCQAAVMQRLPPAWLAV